jgi:gamma-glutamyl-gamma-aminobutyrate hydrolase PuuD
MKIYVAPPRGKLEKESFANWLNYYELEWEWLDLRKRIKGPLLLCGGADIGKDPERDEKEFIWIKQALDTNQPIIGICRGMQILNHYFGGQVKDLEDYIVEEHTVDEFSDNTDHSGRKSHFHLIQDLDGNTVNVNSRHHQHCSQIADNFRVTHISYPGYAVVEGIEDIDRKIWAVQWHPERMESHDNEYPLNKISAK